MGVVGRLDQYASMLTTEFDDYSMSENLLTYGEQFNDASWGKAASSISQNSIAAPDGLTTADTLIENTASSVHAIVRNFTKPAQTIIYTFSIFAKLKDIRNIQILFGGSGVAGGTVNLSTGAIISGPTQSGAYSNTSMKVVPFPNQWYRIIITTTINSSLTSVSINLYSTTIAGTANYLGDGTSGIYIWGAQFEESSAATDYTPTTTTAKTRVLSSTTNTNITGLGTYYSSGFDENVGFTTFLPANVFAPYDPVYDEFGGTLFGAGQGRYMRQYTDKSVIVYNEIDEVSDFRDIVRTGLVLDLDAGMNASYSGSGTTWKDLSGKGYNATLFNSPTFSNGTFQFRVASSQYAICSFDEGLLKNTNEAGSWTIESAFKYISAPSIGEAVVAGRQGCHGGIYINTDSTLQHAIKTDQCWTGASIVTATTMAAGNWYHTTMVYNNGTTLTYLNGTYINSGSINLTTYDIFGYGNNFWIGGIDTAVTDYFTNIDLNFVKCYNRALTAAEVSQNYNALKHRFGL